MSEILPIILSGGSGTRLWPMSRDDMPKQFLPLTAEESMFELTLARICNREKFTAPMIVANAGHREIIEKQLAEANIDEAKLLLEPCARNTAPAIALAALAVEKPDAAMLIMPSDHVIEDIAAFHYAIDAALPAVKAGWLATFGITPTGPETGYGYIQMGDEIAAGVQQVSQFIEKPNVVSAQKMLDTGGYAWNGGIFLFRADVYLTAMETYAPKMLAACKTAFENAKLEKDCILPQQDDFANCPADSIDYAILEKAEKVAVIPVSMGWSDVGSWDALYEIAPANEVTTAIDSTGNLVKSDGINIHLAGVENMIVVASGNDVVIVPRGLSQSVKKITEDIKNKT